MQPLVVSMQDALALEKVDGLLSLWPTRNTANRLQHYASKVSGNQLIPHGDRDCSVPTNSLKAQTASGSVCCKEKSPDLVAPLHCRQSVGYGEHSAAGARSLQGLLHQPLTLGVQGTGGLHMHSCCPVQKRCYQRRRSFEVLEMAG
jgi:hypothetical protein